MEVASDTELDLVYLNALILMNKLQIQILISITKGAKKTPGPTSIKVAKWM